jgi:hypothetical protein
MKRVPARLLAGFLTAVLPASPGALAYETPLQPTSVRDAYFLGQRHDGSLARLLEKCTKHLPQPKFGPHISSIAFFTPFALVAQLSGRHAPGYSAQQAWLDHQGQRETVRIIVRIRLTNSYPAYIPRPTGSPSGSPTGFVPRPYDFWKDFQVQVFNNDQELRPLTSSGKPDYICSEDGGCILTGATLQFEFPADAFDSDSATVEVAPPQGDDVSVGFDLPSLR